METVHYIHYYDQFATLQKVKFSEVFNMWVESLGGKRKFIEIVSQSQWKDASIPATFLFFFSDNFNGIIAPDVNQDYLYNFEIYKMYINRVSKDLENSPLGKQGVQNIITWIIIGLAIIGLISIFT